jgi:hypothetical protein
MVSNSRTTRNPDRKVSAATARRAVIANGDHPEAALVHRKSSIPARRQAMSLTARLKIFQFFNVHMLLRAILLKIRNEIVR